MSYVLHHEMENCLKIIGVPQTPQNRTLLIVNIAKLLHQNKPGSGGSGIPCTTLCSYNRTCWIIGQWGLMGINNVPLILWGLMGINNILRLRINHNQSPLLMGINGDQW